MTQRRTTAGRCVVVPVQGEPEEDEVFRLACRLAMRGRGKVVVVYTIRVPRRLSLDTALPGESQSAEDVLKRFQALGAEEDTPTDTVLLQARQMGPAVLDEVERQDAGLIVAGAGRHQRFGRFALHPDVMYLLEYAPCPVVIWHERHAPPAEEVEEA